MKPPPGAAISQVTGGGDGQHSILDEADLEAPGRGLRSVWRGRFASFPQCLALLPGGDSIMVRIDAAAPTDPGIAGPSVVVGMNTHQFSLANLPQSGGIAIRLLRYREPLIEEGIEEHRVPVPAPPFPAGGEGNMHGLLSPDGRRVAYVFKTKRIFSEPTELDLLRRDLSGAMPPKRRVWPAGVCVWVAEVHSGKSAFLGSVPEEAEVDSPATEVRWTRDSNALLFSRPATQLGNGDKLWLRVDVSSEHGADG